MQPGKPHMAIAGDVEEKAPALSAAVLRRRATYPPNPPATLTLDMVIYYFVSVSPRTLERWISDESFPRADIEKGNKVRLWRRITVEAWIEQHAKGVA